MGPKEVSEAKIRKSEAQKRARQRQDGALTSLSVDVGIPSGRSGGNINREIATRDHMERAFQRPAGATRTQERHKRTNDKKH